MTFEFANTVGRHGDAMLGGLDFAGYADGADGGTRAHGVHLAPPGPPVVGEVDVRMAR
jgi:hypothetical protein